MDWCKLRLLAGLAACAFGIGISTLSFATEPAPQLVSPPQRARPALMPAQEPARFKPLTPDAAKAAEAGRLQVIGRAKSWAYQLSGASVDALAGSPFDLIVVDGTAGLGADKAFSPTDITRLKRKPDGSRRLVLAHLSIGEAEDTRREHVTPEYLEEDAPEWLLHENPQWKGNRVVKFCTDGWHRTILGDDNGRSLYDSVSPSPLFHLIEAGFDGVYLDRVDVYQELKTICPDGDRRMVDFIVRLADLARQAKPEFLVVQQNGEDLLRTPRLVKAIDGIAREGLNFGWGGEGTTSPLVTPPQQVQWSRERLAIAQKDGRAVFVVDYARTKAQAEQAVKRNRDLGFVPYVGPRELNVLFLPGKNF